MSAKIINKMPAFRRNLYYVMDDALREGARDTLINAKNRAPFLKGGLRSDTEISRQGVLRYRVSFWKEYARFQEFGGDATRKVRNYSTSGTGKRYLKTAGDEQAKKINRTFSKHARRAKV
jgi:hypothetical protein